jgi:amphi-Trp domain-containing protein
VARDSFEFARLLPADELAHYLTALASDLKRGRISLESGTRTWNGAPRAEVKVALRVKDRPDRGKIKLALTWKRGTDARAADLRIEAAPRARPA